MEKKMVMLTDNAPLHLIGLICISLPAEQGVLVGRLLACFVSVVTAVLV